MIVNKNGKPKVTFAKRDYHRPPGKRALTLARAPSVANDSSLSVLHAPRAASGPHMIGMDPGH